MRSQLKLTRLFNVHCIYFNSKIIAFFHNVLQCWYPKNAQAAKLLNYLALSQPVTAKISYTSDASHLDQ